MLLSHVCFILEGYEVPEESVMEELFYEYNSEARPASVRRPVVKVSHQLTLTRIISLVLSHCIITYFLNYLIKIHAYAWVYLIELHAFAYQCIFNW